MFFKVQSVWCMSGEDGRVFVDLERWCPVKQFFLFCFYVYELAIFSVAIVQIKLNLILKLTGNWSEVVSQHCSHFTKEGSSHDIEHLIYHLAVTSGELLIVHVLLPALQRRYSGNGVRWPIMLLTGHCNSYKNTFLQMHPHGVLCLIIRLTWICVCSCFFSRWETTLLPEISMH